jgi:hypothetical protein
MVDCEGCGREVSGLIAGTLLGMENYQEKIAGLWGRIRIGVFRKRTRMAILLSDTTS